MNVLKWFLYNYIDLGLLRVKNSDLTLKLRHNIKLSKVRKNKKKLGKSIEECPDSINNREEFGYWEIDTVISEKTNDDRVLLTILERKTRNALVRKIPSKTSEAVMNELTSIRQLFGDKFSQVFKTITGDNGSEFAELSSLKTDTETMVYYTHPYSSFEKGTNERHNRLILRFILKGKSIDGYTSDNIAFIED